MARLARDLSEADVAFEDWQILYRELCSSTASWPAASRSSTANAPSTRITATSRSPTDPRPPSLAIP